VAVEGRRLVEWLKATFATPVRQVMPEDAQPDARISVAEFHLGLRLPLVIRRDYRLEGGFDRANGNFFGCRLPPQPFQSIGLLHRTLRMNARQRVYALLAHWASFPIGINDRGVPVLGKYHGHLVCEQADERFSELAQTVLRLNRIGEQISKRSAFSGYSVVPDQGGGLAPPMSDTGLHDTLGDNAG
jgi:hypothetical protein